MTDQNDNKPEHITNINVPPPPPVPDASEKVKVMLDSAAIANDFKAQGGVKGVIRRCWRGEEKLWKAFWLYGVLPGIVFNIVFGIIGGMLGSIGALVSFLLLLPFTIWNLGSCWRCAWNAGAKIWGIIVRVLVVLGAIGTIFTAFGAVTAAFIGGGTTPTMPVSENAPITAPQPTPDMASPVVPTSPEPSAPVAPMAPVAAPVPAPAPAPAMDACEQRMHDFAVQNNADPAAYIAQNQAYLGECRKALAAQPKP